MRGLRMAMEQLKAGGCRTIYINGSFVTIKPDPGDFDACWDREDYEFTQQLLVEFQESLATLERDEARKANDFDGWELMRGSLKCQLDKLNYEIAEYDRLTSTKEELLASTHRFHSQKDRPTFGQFELKN